jgi:hypothetical protein
MTARTPPAATELGDRDAEMQQGEQQVPHARVSSGQTSGGAQRCAIPDSPPEFTIRDPHLAHENPECRGRITHDATTRLARVWPTITMRADAWRLTPTASRSGS